MRLITIFVFIALVAISIPGLLRLEVNPDVSKALLPTSGDAADAYDRFLANFPADYGSLLAASGDLCSREALLLLEEMRLDLEALPVVRLAIGLSSAEYVTGTADAVIVRDYIDAHEELGGDPCAIATAYTPYRGLLISEDGESIATYVIAEQGVDAATFTEAIESVVATYRPLLMERFNGDLLHSSEMYMSAEITKAATEDMKLLGPVVVIMMVIVGLLTRSFLTGFLAGTTGTGAVLMTFGLMGYLGIAQTPVNGMMVNMLIPLGAAFTVHAFAYAGHENKFAGIWPAVARGPYLFATLSTALGFGSMAITTSPDVRQMGLLGAFGTCACLLCTVLLTFPALAYRKRSIETRDDGALPWILNRTLDVSRPVTLFGTAGLIVISLSGVYFAKVDYGPAEYLPADNPSRVNFEKTRKSLGSYSVPVSVRFEEENAALDPEVWRKMKEFVDAQERSIPGLHAAWLYDQLEVLSQAYSADEPTPQDFPDSPELVAQFILLFDEEDTEPYIDFDRTSFTVLFQTPFVNTSEFTQFEEALDQFRDESGLDIVATGRVANFLRIGQQIAIDNLWSLAISAGVIFALFWALLRSPMLAAIGLTVNLIPVLGCFAALAILRIPIDLGSSIFASIALGLVLDDTGHLMTRYRAMRISGLDSDASARRMVQELWRPVSTTTVVIVIGFSVMNLAEFTPFHSFSRVLSASLLFALIGDLVILPALLRHLDSSPQLRGA